MLHRNCYRKMESRKAKERQGALSAIFSSFDILTISEISLAFIDSRFFRCPPATFVAAGDAEDARRIGDWQSWGYMRQVPNR
jgi:hypothetical protein